MTKTVVRKQSSEVSANVAPEFMGAAGRKEDLLIEKLMLMQFSSDAVKAREAEVGEYRSSQSGEDFGKDVEIVVFKDYKIWHEGFRNKKGRFEFETILPYDGNEQLPREENVNGKEVMRYEVLGFYCVLLKDLMQGMAFPYVVDFKKTSYKAGKQLSTNFVKLAQNNRPSYYHVFRVGSAERANPEGEKFLVKTVSSGRQTTDEERECIVNWIKTMAEQKMKVDESDNSESKKDQAKTF